MENQGETGGEAIVRTLEQAGVRFAYGIPAVHNLPIYDGLYRSKAMLNIPVRHEQSAGFMAIGSAYLSGEPAVCFVGSGPGATNMVTPVCEAYLDSMPMLVVAGGVSLPKIGKGALHDVPHLAIFKSITKRCERVSVRAGLEGRLIRSLDLCRSGRPRPVFIEVPFDVLASSSPPPPSRHPRRLSSKRGDQ
jgi:thiamine pyrophosphate-dependent acetolactate synthase large subunit-like protein